MTLPASEPQLFGDVLDALRDYLEGLMAEEGDLEYIEGVDIALDTPDNFPDFEDYYLRIAPISETENRDSQRDTQKSFEIDLICFLRIGGFASEERALIGDGTGDAPDIGLLKMVEDVKAALRGNTVNGTFDQTWMEFDTEPINCERENMPADIRDYFFKARIRYMPRTEPFLNPA